VTSGIESKYGQMTRDVGTGEHAKTGRTVTMSEKIYGGIFNVSIMWY